MRLIGQSYWRVAAQPRFCQRLEVLVEVRDAAVPGFELDAYALLGLEEKGPRLDTATRRINAVSQNFNNPASRRDARADAASSIRLESGLWSPKAKRVQQKVRLWDAPARLDQFENGS
jgi:hypothetical protein